MNGSAEKTGRRLWWSWGVVNDLNQKRGGITKKSTNTFILDRTSEMAHAERRESFGFA